MIAIEGIPGTGKSTLAAALAKEIEGEVHRLPDGFRRVRDAVDFDHAGALARLLYYLAATVQMAEGLASSDAGKVLIADRYIASPLGLAAAEGVSPRTIRDIARPVVRAVPAPVLTVLLVAPHHVIASRLTERTDSGSRDRRVHDAVQHSPEVAATWAEALSAWIRDSGDPFVIHDTSRRPTASIVDELLGHPAFPAPDV